MHQLAEKISEFVDHTSLAAVPDLARQRGVRAITDTVGVIAAGGGSPTLAVMRRYVADMGHDGNVPVLGCDLVTDAEHAALLNGMAGHALDFDDGYPYYPVHASVPIISAMIAGAAGAPLSGKTLLESYIVGIEVVTAIGRGLGMGHYTSGFHATGTLGIFAATIALAKYRNLDRETTQRCIGIAASMASGIQRNFGTMMKSFHAGWAARNALIVIGMAQHGISAHRDAMDGKNGFFQAYGREDADTERASESLGSSFALVEHGLGMKKFPCVNAAIRPLAGLLKLKRRHSLRANQVKRIVCVLPPGSMKPMHYHSPETGLEGQFSLEYVLAAGLLDDRIGIATFTDEMVQRPAIRSLLGLVEAVEDPRCIADDPLAETRGPGPRGFVEVHVTASSGETHKTCVRVAPGYPGNDLSRTEMWEKFHDCAQYASINSASAQSAFDALMQLEDLTDVSEVLRLMHPSTKEG